MVLSLGFDLINFDIFERMEISFSFLLWNVTMFSFLGFANCFELFWWTVIGGASTLWMNGLDLFAFESQLLFKWLTIYNLKINKMRLSKLLSFRHQTSKSVKLKHFANLNRLGISIEKEAFFIRENQK